MTVSVCQVKAYHTELAATCVCMALIEIHDPKTHLATAANEIHDPIMTFMAYLTRVVAHKGLDKCLGVDSILACLRLLNTGSQHLIHHWVLLAYVLFLALRATSTSLQYSDKGTHMTANYIWTNAKHINQMNLLQW